MTQRPQKCNCNGDCSNCNCHSTSTTIPELSQNSPDLKDSIDDVELGISSNLSD